MTTTCAVILSGALVILGRAKNLIAYAREILRVAQGDRRIVEGDRVIVVVALVFLLTACASGPKMPDWVNGPNAKAYPDSEYMIGVGQGDSRAVAEDRAYAALARIFRADITSQSKDWESYLNLERKGSSQFERKLTVETMTKVSTDKLLENVKIADNWQDPKTGLHAALAVLNRNAARSALSSRIAELDEAIDRDVKASRAATDKLLKLRELHRAIRNLITRETFNTDLRVISGQSMTPAFSVSALTQDVEKFFTDSMAVAVQVQGDQADAVRQAIIETLVREGLPVTAKTSGEGSAPDLIIKGEARLWQANLPDPQFRYVRWCGDFVIVTPVNERVVGSVGRSGREGHINYREASNRALLVLKQEISSAVAKSFAEQVYGEATGDAQPAPPSACPK